jgi:AcrR family transcriptional regulator
VSVRAPYAVAARELLRETLFAAGRGELERRPWNEVTMGDVASAAGVSRQTLYNEFGSRDEFAQALVIREGGRFLDAVEQAIDRHAEDPLAALTAALEQFLRSAEDDPFVRLLLGDDGTGGMLPVLTTQSRPVLEWATARLVGAIGAHWPLVPARDLEALADTLVRLAISHVAAPRASPARTATSITRLLEPSIERMLAGAGKR